MSKNRFSGKGAIAVNTYASLRKKNNGTVLAAIALALCVVMSASMLFSRLLEYSPEDSCHYIPLTRSGGITGVVPGKMDENGRFQAEETAAAAGRPIFLTATPFLTGSSFRVTDDSTVWQGETDIEIFRIRYDNASAELTVNSDSGDQVLAPGTQNTYSFALENTGTTSVQYEMTMEAYFTDGTHLIPVAARVYDHAGNYLAGSQDHWADVLELNGVTDSGTLSAGYVMPYTLQWEWPFELDDEYDTMLGNLAVEEDITLTIVINTLASHSPTGGGIPQTGDTVPVKLLLGLMLGSGAGLVLLLWVPRRKGEENAQT